MGDNPPPSNKTIDEILFGMVDTLCSRFVGLTPFEVLNTSTKQVLEIYVDCILFDKSNKEETKAEKVEWVTSKNASWH